MSDGKNTIRYHLWIAPFLVVIVLAVGSFLWLIPGESQQPSGSYEKITLGAETSLLTAPVWVAAHQGYFQEQGLNVEIREFGSGRTALASMLEKGGLDIVTVAQTPVMFNSFTRNDYVIIGAMVHSNNDVKVLVRQNKGVVSPSDLKGKTVGITKGSTGHFFLGVFLRYHGLGLSDVDAVDLEASELPQAIADGRVDAISTWEPHILLAKNLLGEKALLLPNENMFREDFYFVAQAHNDLPGKHRDMLTRFLTAVETGEEFINNTTAEAIDIVSRRLKVDKRIIATVWDDFEFELILDQSILVSLEDQARWAIDNRLVQGTKVPNYLDFIYTDALEDLKPDAVTVIR